MVEDIGEVLDQQSIKPFQSVEAQHPVIRELSWGAGRLAEVLRISGSRGVRGEASVSREEGTDTRVRTCSRAAPSDRSATVTAG